MSQKVGSGIDKEGQHYIVDRTVYPLKKRGKQGIISACIVLAIVLLIIILSKFNDIRQYRVPYLWKRRAINVIEEVYTKLKAAEAANDNNAQLAFRLAIQSESLLHSALSIIGEETLRRATGVDLNELETKIQAVILATSKHLQNQVAEKNTLMNVKKLTDIGTLDKSIEINKHKIDRLSKNLKSKNRDVVEIKV